MFLGPDDTCNHFQLVVPYNLQSGILEVLYGGVVGGHLGHEKPLAMYKKDFTGLATGMTHETGVQHAKNVLPVSP